jgi:hypothetical protein
LSKTLSEHMFDSENYLFPLTVFMGQSLVSMLQRLDFDGDSSFWGPLVGWFLKRRRRT